VGRQPDHRGEEYEHRKNVLRIRALQRMDHPKSRAAREESRIRAGDNPRTKERFPFSDDELKRMFEACETQYGKRPIVWSRKVHHKPAAPGENAKYRPRGRLRWHQGFR
jgi:hypothetical protein